MFLLLRPKRKKSSSCMNQFWQDHLNAMQLVMKKTPLGDGNIYSIFAYFVHFCALFRYTFVCKHGVIYGSKLLFLRHVIKSSSNLNLIITYVQFLLFFFWFHWWRAKYRESVRDAGTIFFYKYLHTWIYWCRVPKQWGIDINTQVDWIHL